MSRLRLSTRRKISVWRTFFSSPLRSTASIALWNDRHRDYDRVTRCVISRCLTCSSLSPSFRFFNEGKKRGKAPTKPRYFTARAVLCKRKKNWCNSRALRGKLYRVNESAARGAERPFQIPRLHDNRGSDEINLHWLTAKANIAVGGKQAWIERAVETTSSAD